MNIFLPFPATGDDTILAKMPLLFLLASISTNPAWSRHLLPGSTPSDQWLNPSKEGLKPIEIAAVNDNLQAVEILFPATSRISTYPNWSVSEIMRHAHSEGAGVQRKLVQKVKFGDAKSKGDDAYRKKDYITASFCYSKAIIKDPSNASLLSNRSLCWACLNDGVAALNDAMACILLKPHWPKAYYRLGAAWKILGKFDQAADSFYDGLKLDPLSRELKKAYQEAFVEAMLQSISPSAR